MASIRDTLTKLLASDKPEPGTPLARAVGQYPFQQGEAPLEAPMLSPDDLIGMGIGKAALAPLIAGIVKNPSVEKALVNKTAQELAHETAQKNAVEMLGLPQGNTAMERAKALGFDTPGYHGTRIDFTEFQPKSWFSSHPEYASQYSNVLMKNEPEIATQQVFPVLTKIEKPHTVQHFGNEQDMMKILDKPNKGAYVIENVGGGNTSHYVIKDPRNIRSINAAFDPKLTGAAAIAAGTASADLLADEDKQKLIKALKQQ
jgi:hypothetical protein